MAHYDWDCDTCGSGGGIYDDEYRVTLNKSVTVPHSGGHQKRTVSLCKECHEKLSRNTGLPLWRTEQFIDQSNVVGINKI